MDLMLHKGGTANWGISLEALEFIKNHLPSGARTLETGAGISTIFFAKQGYRHTAVTPSADEVERIKTACKEQEIDLSKVDFRISPSEMALPAFNEPLDLVLIDGGHGFPVPQIDWYYGSRCLKVGGLLAVDDVPTWTGGILRDFLRKQPGWTYLTTISAKTAFFRLDRAFQYTEWNEQPYVVSKSRVPRLLAKLSRLAALIGNGDWQRIRQLLAKYIRGA